MGLFEDINGKTRAHRWELSRTLMGNFEAINGGLSRPLMGEFEDINGNIRGINGAFRGH